MDFNQYLGLFCGFWATLFNSLLIPIILIFSSDKIGNYKYCLLLYSTSALTLSCCQLNTLLVWYAPKYGFLLYSTMTIYPYWLQKIFMSLFPSGFCGNLVALCWSFMARLSILEGVDLFQRPLKKKVKGLLIFTVVMFTTSQIVMVPIYGSQRTAEIFREQILNVSGIDLTKVAFIGTPILGYGFPYEMATAVGFYFIFMGIAGTCIITCWIKIHRRLRALRQQQISSFKIQHRLYILLTLQAIFPLIFNISPCGLACFVGLTQIDLGFLVIFCASILSVAQILDPIFTVILIKDYQQGILRILGLSKATIRDVSTSNISNTIRSARSRAMKIFLLVFAFLFICSEAAHPCDLYLTGSANSKRAQEKCREHCRSTGNRGGFCRRRALSLRNKCRCWA